jgi:hypothetical protein
MAILMVSLNPTKTGEFVARKVIPKDARGEYKRLYGVSRRPWLLLPQALLSTLLTDMACHCPPRAVAMPLALSASAIS